MTKKRIFTSEEIIQIKEIIKNSKTRMEAANSISQIFNVKYRDAYSKVITTYGKEYRIYKRSTPIIKENLEDILTIFKASDNVRKAAILIEEKYGIPRKTTENYWYNNTIPKELPLDTTKVIKEPLIDTPKECLNICKEGNNNKTRKPSLLKRVLNLFKHLLKTNLIISCLASFLLSKIEIII